MHRFDHLLEPGRLLSGPLVGALLRDHLAISELETGQRLGPFRIVRELGRGGMGIVYLALRDDGSFEQEVAIKWLPVGRGSPRADAQFRHERQMLAALNHPHIARIIDGGASPDGHLWFAMEHVDGPPIDEYVDRLGLDWRQRVRLLLPILDAVQFAHARLLVHRDIKPANVLIDTEGRAMLVDFGIAALLTEDTAHPAFTDGFASPEQRAGAAPDITHDVWQLGKLLEAVLDVHPADGRPPRWPADLIAIVKRASENESSRRYGNVAALRADLKRLLSYRPVSARPPGLWHRLGLLCRAHPWGVGSTIAALICLITLSAAFTWRLATQRDAALHARTTAEAVNAFLQDDLLAGADPLQGGSGSITMATLAERAVERAESRLRSLPEVAARVELGLGRTLGGIGHLKTAGHAFDLAIGHLTRLYGEGDERVLRARLQREQYAVDRDQLARAEVRLDRLRSQALAALGNGNPLLIEIAAQQARAAQLRGDFADCIARYRAVLPRLDRIDAVPRADSYMNLSICEARLNQGAAALAHGKLAVAISTENLGPDHPYTLESAMAVETALMSLGRYVAAVQQLQPLLNQLDARYGLDHPVTINAAHDLGYALTCDQRPRAGAHWLEQASELRARVLGPQHPWTAMSQSVLGMALLQSGQLEQAERTLAAARQALGTSAATAPFVNAVLLQNEADLALAQHQPARALSLYDETLAVAHSLYAADHPRLAVIEIGRGLALVDSGQRAQGTALLRSALTRLGTRPDCRAAQRARAQQLLTTAD